MATSGTFQRVGVVGAGAWGTALAITAHRAGRDTVLWARRGEVADAIARTRVNAGYLPGHVVDAAIAVTADPAALTACGAVLLASPAQATRAIATLLAPSLRPGAPVVVCAKGIERTTGRGVADIATEALPGHPVALLSGPSFAEEVARGLPTAVTLACRDAALGEALARALRTATFRPYWTDDVAGVALGGAVKNVLAIACGIVDGKRLGDNARAALITRGFAEMARLGAALGARLETMAGLAGLGDLVLTCGGRLSRNHALGVAVGAGARAADFLAGKTSVAEGFHTAPALRELARARGVDMPICTAVADVLHDGADVDATIRALLARPLKGEGE